VHLWQVTTYDVIPVSQSVGLMEFVPDTDQLLTVISPGVIPVEDVDAARKAYSSCATAVASVPHAPSNTRPPQSQQYVA